MSGLVNEQQRSPVDGETRVQSLSAVYANRARRRIKLVGDARDALQIVGSVERNGDLSHKGLTDQTSAREAEVQISASRRPNACSRTIDAPDNCHSQCSYICLYILLFIFIYAFVIEANCQVCQKH